MSKSISPPRKKYKQASLLSFMQTSSSNPKSKTVSRKGQTLVQEETDSQSQDSDIICLESTHYGTLDVKPGSPMRKLSPSGSTAGPSGQKSGLSSLKAGPSKPKPVLKPCPSPSEVSESEGMSQESDDVTHPLTTSSDPVTSPLPTAKEISTSSDAGDSRSNDAEQQREETNESLDLFDSDSSILTAAMEDSLSQSQDSCTLVYTDSLSDSQCGDLGTPLDELRLFPDVDKLPRRLKPDSPIHKQFITTPTVPGEVPSPCCKTYRDVWDGDHVRMPCSPQNLYPDERERGKTKNRWSLIETALLSSITSSYDIEEAVLSYNSRYKGKWNFSILHETINDHMTQAERDELFTKVIPSMVQLTLSLPSALPVGVPLLRQQIKYSLTFSQYQLACLLANAFFCTFPRRNAFHRSSEYANFPSINMNGMFAQSDRSRQRDGAMVHKLKCIFHYFKKISQTMPTGCVTFKRKVVEGLSPSLWSKSTQTLSECLISSTGLIEAATRCAQADFANCMIGGGVLRTGCVQEEIQFVIHPELIVSRLFAARLSDNEVLVIKGAERFSDYIGYSNTFEFDGGHCDKIAMDDLGRRYSHIIAMDATRYTNSRSQYATTQVLRDINKAYCGFYSNNPSAVSISTGNWGCGAFNGDRHLKGLIQLMAAAVSGRQLYYSVYGDSRLKQDLYTFHQFCVTGHISVGQLWSQIVLFGDAISKDRKFSQDILQFVRTGLS